MTLSPYLSCLRREAEEEDSVSFGLFLSLSLGLSVSLSHILFCLRSNFVFEFSRGGGRRTHRRRRLRPRHNPVKTSNFCSPATTTKGEDIGGERQRSRADTAEGRRRRKKVIEDEEDVIAGGGAVVQWSGGAWFDDTHICIIYMCII